MKTMKTNDTVRFQVRGNPPVNLEFTFRDGSSPAAFHLILALEGRMRTWKFDTDATREQQIERGKEFGDAIFPDEETTQRNMRIILTGPHDQINWYLDSSWPRLVAIAADWFTRTQADIKRAERDEKGRMDIVAARIEEQLPGESNDE